MWSWLPIAAGVLAGLAGAMAVVGLVLPRHHLARGSAIVAAPPGQVAAMVREVERQPEWRRAVTAVEVQAREGTRTDYVEISGSDRIRFILVEEARDTRFVSTIVDDTLPFGGSWTILLASDGGGTKVTIEERGEVRNPLFRFLAAFVFGHEATLKAYLADLSKAA